MAAHNSIERARAARARKAKALADLKDGRISLTAVLISPPSALRSCTLWSVLITTHNLGPTGARKVCEDSKIFAETTLRDLTPKQRLSVVKHLPKRVR